MFTSLTGGNYMEYSCNPKYIYTGQKTGMDSRSKSNITVFITALDEAGEISTPNGKVQFVQDVYKRQ